MRISLIVLLTILIGCGGIQHPKNDIRLEKGGESYCKAFYAKDNVLKKDIAKKYQLQAEHWESYCLAMKDRRYAMAMNVATESHLGKTAVRNAGMKSIWRDFNEGFIYGAYRVSKELGFSKSESRSISEIALSLKLQNRKCDEAMEIVNMFELSHERAQDALSCMAKQSGLAIALRAVCVSTSRTRLTRVYKKRFLANLSQEYRITSEWNYFRRTILRCKWQKNELEILYLFLRKEEDVESSVLILEQLRSHLTQEELLVRARLLFDEALAKKHAIYFDDVYKAFPKVLDDARKSLVLQKYIETRRCGEALFFAHVQNFSQEKLNAIFVASRCAMSDFEKFEWKFPWNNNAPLEKYYHLALKHQSFVFAHRLARRLSGQNKGEYNYSESLIDEAFRVKAHALLLVLSPPSDEDVQDYKNRIFEDALDAEEEWVAATYAREHHLHPESIIERAYLSAAERGEFILAVQIAKTYGQKSKEIARGILAFEMAMIAKKPQDAQFIMRLIGLEDSIRLNRAAKLRFKMRQEKQRKALRIKRNKERKKKRASGDWSVQRE